MLHSFDLLAEPWVPCQMAPQGSLWRRRCASVEWSAAGNHFRPVTGDSKSSVSAGEQPSSQC